MGNWLSEREQRLVAGAEEASAETPIPTQIVSNGEYLPPQTKCDPEEGRAPHRRARRCQCRAARPRSPAVPAHELRHGGGVRRHERDLRRQRLPGDAGRGARARAGAGARRGAGRPVHLRRADPLRARRLRPQAAPGPGRVREPALEPQAEGGGRGLARPLQIPELREGDLLRQRHQPGAVERRAVRRPDLVVPVQRSRSSRRAS